MSLLEEQRRWKEAEQLAVAVLEIQNSLKDTLSRTTAGHLATTQDAMGNSELAPNSVGRRLRALTPQDPLAPPF